MSLNREVHSDFLNHLKYKDQELIDLYLKLRLFVLDQFSDVTELIYHTHALTSVYSLSEKLGDAFCMIPIYTNHLNLGFNKGTLLSDPNGLLKGTGKLIRHIPVTSTADFNTDTVKRLISEAITFAQDETKSTKQPQFKIISKIKSNK